ncbi:MAG: LysR family transcriptional regulator [Actinobacteria bacterium]|nr:LysR family transcriptional regulator [Actinomycetota bacterium]
MAEELHFSRAAARLNLTQSALSAQVRALEGEIGGRLLDRTTRRVRLTDAGESLLADAKILIANADNALDRARAIAHGKGGILSVGSLGPAPGDLLSPIMDEFGQLHPHIRVEIEGLDFSNFVDALLCGQVDLSFVYLPLDQPKISTVPLVTEPRVVAVPSSHRLADRPQLCPADLAEETFVTQPSTAPLAWRDYWLLAEQIGSRPAVSPHVPDRVEDWLLSIGRGDGVDTAPAVVSRYYAWPEVRFIPLTDAPPTTLGLGWLSDVDNSLTAEFVSIAQQIATVAARDSASSYQLPLPELV